MEKFSERINKMEMYRIMKHDQINEELRKDLWGLIVVYIMNGFNVTNNFSTSNYKSFLSSLWNIFFIESLDSIPYTPKNVFQNLKKNFFHCDYLDTYDIIEFIANSKETPFEVDSFIEDCNFILKSKLSGYRFVNTKLVPIANEAEMERI